MPQAARLLAELPDGPCIPSDAVVLAIPAYHGPQPLAYLGDRVVLASPQLRFDLLELGPQSSSDGVPTYREPSLSSSATTVHEP